ncbi:MAG TPA: EamA family transporter, partial [Verrucomicrobia bacterium]|nr:EamA family transporter [Verrucomicrobiota bacterium]
VLASVVLSLMCLAVYGKSMFRIRRDLWLSLILLGTSGVFGYSLLFFKGLQSTDAGRAALIIGCTPVCIAALSAVLERRCLAWPVMVGIVLSLLGGMVVIAKGNWRGLLSGQLSSGDVMIFGCVLLWTVYTLLARPVMKTIPPLITVAWSCIVGTVLLLPFALANGLGQDIVGVGNSEWLALVYLGVLATALAYYWYYLAIRQVGTAVTGIFINLVPLFAVLLSGVFLKERLHWSSALGGVLVIAGVFVTVLAGNRK